MAISSRSMGRLKQEVERLGGEFGQDRVVGQACDVTEIKQVQALWDTAKQKFGKVDIWINNAGITNPTRLLWEVDPAEISPVSF